ncbi:MAG: hypothetical protein IKC27_07230 [Kiritimatiellae bacterium]|nr:hypothetical protein [Kiritimatiellia bacterium]
MNKLVVSMLCVLTLVPSFAMEVGVDSGRCGSFLPPSSDDSGMTPGGVQKKYVGLLFDVINTTPSNILANADQFAEHAPYLDGVAIGLNKIPVTTTEGVDVFEFDKFRIYKIGEPIPPWPAECEREKGAR